MKREDLLGIKVAVGDKSAEVQERLFELGFKWLFDGTVIQYTDYKYIYVDWAGDILKTNDDKFFQQKDGYREVPLEFVLGVELPECDFKPFDKVLVRNGEDDLWRPAFFSRVVYGDKPYSTIVMGKYAMCIAWDGNEDLVFTKNNGGQEMISKEMFKCSLLDTKVATNGKSAKSKRYFSL